MDLRDDIHNPFDLFDQWYEEAQGLDLKDSNAMVLSTASVDGIPSSRVVLLKHYDAKGFCFYTNITSDKGEQLRVNSNVALNLYWESLGKQIRIQGKAEPLSDEEADGYFASRPRGSQIGAWASQQSRVLHSRKEFERAIEVYEKKYQNQDVPRPPYWSGFRVVPLMIEFWQAGEYRLHDRLVFKKEFLSEADWETYRLYP